METSKKCIVLGCENHEHEGRFVGALCAPCHHILTTGESGYTSGILQIFRDRESIYKNRAIIKAAMDFTAAVLPHI